MNIVDRIRDYVTGSLEEIERIQKRAASKKAVSDRLVAIVDRLSPACDCNAYGDSIWIYCKNREDLELLMTLAPVWKKDYEDVELNYCADVDGIEVILKATDSALPATCHMEEKEVLIPSHFVPERVEKRRVIVCNETVTKHVDEQAQPIPVNSPAGEF
jgi:hypothetical protein